MSAPIAVRLADHRAQPIDLSSKVRSAIAEEAAFRRVSPGGLVAMLLEAIVAGDQFSDVLSRRDGK